MKMFYSVLSTLLFLAISTQGSAQKYYGGEEGKKLDWVMYYLNEFYVDTTDNAYLTDVAIKAIVAELDPYSVYQTAEEIEAQNNADAGYSDEDFGFYYSEVGDFLMVTYIFKDGPADKAGLKTRDRIISVNAKSTYKQFKNQLQDELANEEIRTLTMEVLDPYDVPRNISIEKAKVPLISVEAVTPVAENISYIKFNRFTAKTLEEFTAAIGDLPKGQQQNIILDFRGNPGGVVVSSTKLADEFLPKNKLISYSQGFNLEKTEYKTEKSDKFSNSKLILLVDGNTVSAAELFASSLQDWDRAMIIGQPTFGKGLIQQSYSLEDGSAIRLTIGKYYTPTGRNLQKGMDENCSAQLFDKINYTCLSKDLPTAANLLSSTRGGRKIAACQGGIIPDMFVPVSQKADPSFNALNEQGLVFGFTCQYVRNNGNDIFKKYGTYDAFATDQQMETELIQKFQSYVETKILANGLDSAIFPRTVSTETISKIKSWMAGQIWGLNAYYYSYLLNDPVVIAAKSAFIDGSYDKVMK